MNIKFYKINVKYDEVCKDFFNDDNLHWCIVLGNKQIRFKTNDVIGDCHRLSINKNSYNLLSNQYTEYFPAITKSTTCRICKHPLSGEFHKDGDGLCEQCWEGIMKNYFKYDEYVIFGDLLKLNKKSSTKLTKSHLLRVIKTECTQHSSNFKIRKTSATRTRLGTCRYSGYDISSITYSHLVPIKQQISILIHEFAHAYCHIHLTRNERSDELLIQKVEAYVYNYFLYSEDEVNAYSYAYFEKYRNNLNYIKEYRDDLARDLAKNIIKVIEKY